MSKKSDVLKIDVDDERDAAVIAAGFLPGWIGEGGLRYEPLQDFQPNRWRWRDGKPLLQEAATYINPEKSERRNIRMANPAKGKRTSLSTLHCSYQMVGPGQFARAHRHTINAGRFILESDGAYTTLDGKKISMDENDIIFTPNWVWHGLGNESVSNSVSWIDFLDDPLVSHLQTIFFEVRDEQSSSLPLQEGSPLQIKWLDIKLKLANQTTTDPLGRHRVELPSGNIPTMRLFAEDLPAGHQTRRSKSTANRLFMGAEGAGVLVVGDKFFDWTRGDVVAVPAWTPFYQETSIGGLLIEINDEPVKEAFGWYRESHI